jgi:hypothetical protein
MLTHLDSPVSVREMEQINKRHALSGEVRLLGEDPLVPLQLDLEEGFELVDKVVVSRNASAGTSAGDSCVGRKGNR